MDNIVLRYEKEESIGSINSVDTGMATAIIDLDDVLSQLQINQRTFTINWQSENGKRNFLSVFQPL